MTRVRTVVAVLVLVGLLTAPAASREPPRVPAGIYNVEPPAEIKALLSRLKERDRPTEAIRLLGARDAAAPYLRLELRAATDEFVKRSLGEALSRIEARAYERNKKRYAAWAEGGRLDLCAELLVACPEKDDAPALADFTLPVRKRIAAGWTNLLARYPAGYRGPRLEHFGPRFGGSKQRFNQEAGAELTLSNGEIAWVPTLLRAERCTFQYPARYQCFAAVRSELRDEFPPKAGFGKWGHWIDSVVLVNNSIKLGLVEDTLIVCDGDVELDTGIARCVVIANGKITGAGDRQVLFCATGDIVSAGRKEVGDNVLHAGGNVMLAGKPKLSERVREKQAALPFGVRFLDPAEFGLVLSAQNGGVQVMGISPDSPFARYDVKDGDVITSIDDVAADTVATFRRQLRRGVLAESVFLRIQRGRQSITRIVFLDGIPLPVAPVPRESADRKKPGN
jgi:hypothetical protein